MRVVVEKHTKQRTEDTTLADDGMKKPIAADADSKAEAEERTEKPDELSPRKGLLVGFIHGMRVATPNDRKLSDHGGRRSLCGRRRLGGGGLVEGAVKWCGGPVGWCEHRL